MTEHSAPTRGAMELARRIVGEFRPNGWESKVEEVAHALDRYRLAAIEECAKAIADLPTGRTEEVMEGHEDAYRAIERLRNLGRGV